MGAGRQDGWGELAASRHTAPFVSRRCFQGRTAGAVEEGLHLGAHHAVAGGDAKEVAVERLELVELVVRQHGVVALAAARERSASARGVSRVVSRAESGRGGRNVVGSGARRTLGGAPIFSSTSLGSVSGTW